MRTTSTRQKGWIGVDLGTWAVKIAQVERTGPRFRLVAAGIVVRSNGDSDAPPGETNPPAANADRGRLADTAWAQRARQLLQRSFSGRKAACMLPMDCGELRPMNLPPGSPPERRAMIATELLEMAAAETPNRIFDYWDTRAADTAANSNLENVNVLCLAEEDATGAAAVLDRLGLRVEAIDGLPTVLARAVQMREAEAGGPVAAVDWGARNATLCLVEQGTAVYTRQLRDCGFAALPQAVQRALGLSPGDAQQLLRTYGVVDPSKGPDPWTEVRQVLTDIVAEPVAALVAEIQRTLAYPELHRASLLPHRLWLFGGGATVRNIAPYLAARIGLPVEPWHLDGPETSGAVPEALLGPAASLSALAWEYGA